MTLEGELNVYVKGLDKTPIDLAKLRSDVASKQTNLDLRLSSVRMPTGFDIDVIQWAAEMYNVEPKAALTAENGKVVGYLDLTEVDLERKLRIYDDHDYESAFDIFRELGVDLSEQSKKVIEQCRKQKGCSAVDAMSDLVHGRTGQQINLRQEFLMNRFVLKQGRFKLDTVGMGLTYISRGGAAKLVATGYGYPYYNIEPKVFYVRPNQKDSFSVAIVPGDEGDLDNTYSIVRILDDWLFRSIKDDEQRMIKAIETFKVLAQYAIKL